LGSAGPVEFGLAAAIRLGLLGQFLGSFGQHLLAHGCIAPDGSDLIHYEAFNLMRWQRGTWALFPPALAGTAAYVISVSLRRATGGLLRGVGRHHGAVASLAGQQPA